MISSKKNIKSEEINNINKRYSDILDYEYPYP